jgi:hypothetical protein
VRLSESLVGGSGEGASVIWALLAFLAVAGFAMIATLRGVTFALGVLILWAVMVAALRAGYGRSRE